MKIPMLNRILSRQTHRVKLIFNPSSGMAFESGPRLLEVIQALQAQDFLPEIHILEPGGDLRRVVRDAIRRGIRLVAACGGDGTIDSVARMVAGTPAALGVIPAGTQNNVAFSLGIPGNIPDAVAVLRRGRRIKVDMGLAVCGEQKRLFLEACSVGLFSALFPSADQIQHGNLAGLGDFFATLVSSQPAAFSLALEGEAEETVQGHVALVSNTPFIGPRYQVGPGNACQDGVLDVVLFANLNLFELMGYAVKVAGDAVKVAGGAVKVAGGAVQVAGGAVEDPRIRHFHVRSLEIVTDPPMPVVVDGFSLGQSPLRIQIKRRALAVMAPRE